MELDELAKTLETVIKKEPTDTVYQGLTELHAEEKLKKFGPNALSEKKTLPWPIKLLLCMTGLFNYVIWAAGILSFIAFGIQETKDDKSNLYLGIILVCLVTSTGFLTYY